MQGYSGIYTRYLSFAFLNGSHASQSIPWGTYPMAVGSDGARFILPNLLCRSVMQEDLFFRKRVERFGHN